MKNKALLIGIVISLLFFKGLDLAVEKYFPYNEWYMYIVGAIGLAIIFKKKVF